MALYSFLISYPHIFVKLVFIYFFAYVIIILYYNSPPAWGLGEGLTAPDRKKTACYKMLHRTSELVGYCEVGWLVGWLVGR
jgi:hypothetical protein